MLNKKNFYLKYARLDAKTGLAVISCGDSQNNIKLIEMLSKNNEISFDCVKPIWYKWGSNK